MNKINIDQTVYEIVCANPEVKELLIDLGFKPLANPAMFNSVARLTSLRKGAKMIGLEIQELVQALKWNGYEVEGYEDGAK